MRGDFIGGAAGTSRNFTVGSGVQLSAPHFHPFSDQGAAEMRSCAATLAVFALLGIPGTLRAQILIPEPAGRIVRPIPRPVEAVYRVKSVDVQSEVRDQ